MNPHSYSTPPSPSTRHDSKTFAEYLLPFITVMPEGLSLSRRQYTVSQDGVQVRRGFKTVSPWGWNWRCDTMVYFGEEKGVCFLCSALDSVARVMKCVLTVIVCLFFMFFLDRCYCYFSHFDHHYHYHYIVLIAIIFITAVIITSS